VDVSDMARDYRAGGRRRSRVAGAALAALGIAALAAGWPVAAARAEEAPLRIATVVIGATPWLGTPISFGAATLAMDPLSSRGLLLLGDWPPVALGRLARDPQRRARRVLAREVRPACRPARPHLYESPYSFYRNFGAGP